MNSAPTKKDETHERIVSEAAMAIRSRGVDGVGVRDVMKQAGLTRGGFYFHFKDKNELFLEASRKGFEELDQFLTAIVASSKPGMELHDLIHSYLSDSHRDSVESGCIVAALASDLVRMPISVRKAFLAMMKVPLSRVGKYLPGDSDDDRQRKAGVLLASMAGIMMVARILPEPSVSSAFLRNAAESLSSAWETKQK